MYRWIKYSKEDLMNFTFSDEQEELRRSVHRFLDEKSPSHEVRRLMEDEKGYDPQIWDQMANQLGLQAMIIPEEYGGAGFSYAELTIVFEEMGRVLLCAPYFSTIALAANALLVSNDDDAKAAYLPGIAAGSTVATLASCEDNGDWNPTSITTQAQSYHDHYVLDGHKNFVVDGLTANLLLATALTPVGVSLFAVDGSAPGLSRTPLATMDQTRKQARLEFSKTPAWLVGREGTGGTVIERALQLAAIALAAEQVGGAQRCLEMSVEYAKTRVQFGRLIGSFQAIKHKCADMLLRVESARSAAYYAGWCAADNSPELSIAASLAKSYCSEAYFSAAADNIQIHGGIGFTWEHDAHLYYKRAKSSELLLGNPVYHRELIAQRIGL